MDLLKDFFSITDDKYNFEIYDLTSLITVLNVTFILMGMWWAPILGLINCAIFFVIGIKYHLHINNYITQLALVILNIYFLTM